MAQALLKLRAPGFEKKLKDLKEKLEKAGKDGLDAYFDALEKLCGVTDKDREMGRKITRRESQGWPPTPPDWKDNEWAQRSAAIMVACRRNFHNSKNDMDVFGCLDALDATTGVGTEMVPPLQPGDTLGSSIRRTVRDVRPVDTTLFGRGTTLTVDRFLVEGLGLAGNPDAI